MLRTYLLQCWFHLSDEGVEDAIYDSYAFRKFMGINFLEQDVPDATTLLHFRYLLEENGLNKLFFLSVNLGMGAVVYDDSGYLGLQKREEIQADPHLASIDYRINRRPKSLPKVSDRAIDWERYIESRKSSVRCKVEHASRIIKRQFGFQKAPYRGLAKNENRLYTLRQCQSLCVGSCRSKFLQGIIRGQSALFRGQAVGKRRLKMKFPPLRLLNLCPLCSECVNQWFPFYQIFPDVSTEMGLLISDIVHITGLTDWQVRTIIFHHMKEAPLPIALQLSHTMDVPLEVWAGNKEYRTDEISVEAKKVAMAYDKAASKDKAMVRMALDLPPMGQTVYRGAAGGGPQIRRGPRLDYYPRIL